MDEILAAVEEINGHYERHRREALNIVRECFSYEIVLGRILDDLGISLPHRAGITTPRRPESADAAATSSVAGASRDVSWLEKRSSEARGATPVTGQAVIPESLILTPTGRWPTRLPEDTTRTALALPAPKCKANDRVEDRVAARSPTRASIVIVTCDGLVFTKLCLTGLLSREWNPLDEVIIVDNASTDGTLEYLEEVARLNPFVRLVHNDRNRGFAAANNQAFSIAKGEKLVLLNADTLTPAGWLDPLLGWLEDPNVGLVGPVTNRTCNEAQIDVDYRTYEEMERFAREYADNHRGQSSEVSMLAMFCLAMRRNLLDEVGSLDEQFEIGMFEDDDYSHRVRRHGHTILCAEDLFVHHFGQAAFGALRATGNFDRLFAENRRRFESKWGVSWKPHNRRITQQYRKLRESIKEIVAQHLPESSILAVISMGDEELLNLNSRQAWHFPQAADGTYAGNYPADSAEAITHLEQVRNRGAHYLLIPQPAFWWLSYYAEFRTALERDFRLAVRHPDSCLIFELGGANG
jgi:GT2 family glycosyltransferase